MDENAFMHALGAVNPKPCAFEKAILSRRCACTLADKRFVAEREMVGCKVPQEREKCNDFLTLLRQGSAFALKLTHIAPQLSYAQESKVQCGGLLGLQHEIDGADEVSNVTALVEQARQKFGSFEEIPYSRIVQSVVSYQVRKRPAKE